MEEALRCPVPMGLLHPLEQSSLHRGVATPFQARIAKQLTGISGCRLRGGQTFLLCARLFGGMAGVFCSVVFFAYASTAFSHDL